MRPDIQLGPYRIIELLGADGMGEVYLAQDTRLGRKVAIKVLPPEFAADPERLARFQQEAQAVPAAAALGCRPVQPDLLAGRCGRLLPADCCRPRPAGDGIHGGGSERG